MIEHNFTILNDDRVNWRIQNDLEMIENTLLQKCTGIEALILVGGFGRGDGRAKCRGPALRTAGPSSQGLRAACRPGSVARPGDGANRPRRYPLRNDREESQGAGAAAGDSHPLVPPPPPGDGGVHRVSIASRA